MKKKNTTLKRLQSLKDRTIKSRLFFTSLFIIAVLVLLWFFGGDGYRYAPFQAPQGPRFTEGDYLTNNISSISATGYSAGELYLMYTIPYSGRPGSRVTLYGIGFLGDGNDVLFNGVRIAKGLLPNDDGLSLSFFIPEDISPGRYTISIRNRNGTSKQNTFFVVTPPYSVTPTINSITPEKVRFGETVTIHGSGFLRDENIVRTSYGILASIPSDDGVTLSFKVSPGFLEELRAAIAPQPIDKIGIEGMDMWVVVENTYGVSNTGRFVLVP